MWQNRFLRVYHTARKLKVNKRSLEKIRKDSAKEALETGEPMVDIFERKVNRVIYNVPNTDN